MIKKNTIIILKGLAVIIISYILGQILGALTGKLLHLSTSKLPDLNTIQDIQRVIVAAISCVLLYLLFKLNLFRKITLWRNTCILSILIILLTLIVNFEKSFSINSDVVFTKPLITGIWEEVFFRGVIFSVFLKLFQNKNSFLWASIGSSIIFGLAHLNNISADDQSMIYTIYQVIFAITMGLLLSLLFYISKNIIVPIFVHFMVDFISPMISINNVMNVSIVDWIRMIVFVCLSIVVYIYFYRTKVKNSISMY